MEKRLLITGMEGMAGTHLAIKAAKEYQVFGTHLPTIEPKFLKPLIASGEITAIPCDLTDGTSVGYMLAKAKPDIIVHLAGLTRNSPSLNDPSLIVNTTIMVNVLQEVVAPRLLSPKIILASTVNLYAPTSSPEPLTEESPLNPSRSFYTLSKYNQENILHMFGREYSDISYVIARMSQHTGPMRGYGFVETDIGSQILDIESERSNQISVRNAAAEVPLMDVNDAVEAYLTLIREGVSGEVYNVASDKGYRVREIAEKMVGVSDIADKKGVVVTSANSRDTHERYSNERIKALGWQPRIPLAATFTDLLAWMRDPTILPSSPARMR